jgi:hypothetical protein
MVHPCAFIKYKYKNNSHRTPLDKAVKPSFVGHYGVRVNLTWLFFLSIIVSTNEAKVASWLSIVIVLSLIGICLSASFQGILSEQNSDAKSISEKLNNFNCEEVIAEIVKSKTPASRFGWIGFFGSSTASISLFIMVFMVEGGVSILLSFFLAFAMMREAFVSEREWSASSKIAKGHDFSIEEVRKS